MPQVFKREMRAQLIPLLVCCLGMALFVGLGFYKYDSIATADVSLVQIMDMMPRIVLVMFGMGELSIDTPEGFYACMYSFIAIFAYAYAAMSGANILSKEERDLTSDFLYTRPRSRASLLTGKLLACIAGCALLTGTAWLTVSLVFVPMVEAQIQPIVHTTMGCMLLTQMLFLLAGFCGAALSRDYRRGTKIAGLLLLGSYLAALLIELKGDIAFLDFLSPFRYFGAPDVIRFGPRVPYIALSAALLALMTFAAYKKYARRDLRSG